MEKFKANIYPDEMAEILCGLAMQSKESDDQSLIGLPVLYVLENCIKAIQQLEATAENPYNHGCYRIIYKVLEEIVKENMR